MQFSFRRVMKIASCDLVLCAGICMPAIAQQDVERIGLGGRGEVAAAASLSDEPADSVALTLWILTVGDTPTAPEDELSGRLMERVGELPPVIGSFSDVRELVGQLKVAGLLRSSREFRVATLDGQSIMAQRGRNQPRVVAMSMDPRSGRTNSLQMEPVGTIVELRPLIDRDRNIKVSVKISESDITKSTDVLMAEPADGSPLFADVVTTRQFNTAASLKNDTAVLLQSVGVSSSDDDESETELIILSATVVPAKE